MQIKRETFLDWLEGLAYACNDVNLKYKDKEAEEQVRGVYKEMVELAKARGIDLRAEMKKRGILAENP